MPALGQVFTPPALAAEILAAIPATPERVLDPACGDGSFLAEAARRWPGAELVGYEADPAVAAAARLRLPRASIQVADALGMPIAPEFDLVAGNPPYAAAFRDDADRARVRAAHVTARGSFDLAVPFVERAVGWLRPGGWLALVVTNKLLVKDYAAPLRAYLLENAALEEVWDLAAAPAFPGTAVDVAVLIARRGPAAGRPWIVLGRKDGTRERYQAARLPVGPRARWEVYRTPAVAAILAALEKNPRLGELEGVTIRDGIQGRDYHKVDLEAVGPPAVGVGRINPGTIDWDRPMTRGGVSYPDPRIQVTGPFAEFCNQPKILIRGVARQLVAAYCARPAVPMVAVRAVTGHGDPEQLVRWFNSPLASFYLQVTSRSDRIPKGSYNISKAWLQDFPVLRPARRPAPPDQAASLIPAPDLTGVARGWLEAYGI